MAALLTRESTFGIHKGAVNSLNISKTIFGRKLMQVIDE